MLNLLKFYHRVSSYAPRRNAILRLSWELAFVSRPKRWFAFRAEYKKLSRKMVVHLWHMLVPLIDRYRNILDRY